ncbi:hypothetical protein TCON_2334, partial [Astathelohania contejeani]
YSSIFIFITKIYKVYSSFIIFNHKKLYRARSNDFVSLKDSSTCMIYRNIDPCDVAIYFYIEYKNVFWRDDALQCQHCGKAKKTIDHLATGCDRMYGHDITLRHNQVFGCITFYLRISVVLKNKKTTISLSPGSYGK